MLIRVDGAREGIRDYLEKGHKQGRAFGRDALDERVILDGDLTVTDRIINEMEIEGEKYLHITLGFKEDQISNETLQNVLRDVKDFTFSAYKEGEYNFYAEAHLPKIKSYQYVDKDTGEVKTAIRKPHIHIVIPKINLWSGNHLNPFGLYEKNERFVEAIQEYVNQKYGLASPKDNRRVEITSASEMIARQVEGDEFEAYGSGLKRTLRLETLKRGIISYEDFKTMAEQFGEVDTRNKGKSNEYLWIKPHGEKKGSNLRNHAFSRQFFESGEAQERARDAAEMVRQYDGHGVPREPDAALVKTLRDWREVNARQVKHINSGSGARYKAYQKATREEKRATLAECSAAFYSKYEPQDADHERRDASADLERINNNLRAAGRQLQTAGRHIEQVRRASTGAGNLADRRNRRALAAAFERFARDQGPIADQQRIEREADNVAEQLARDLRERQAQQRGGDNALFKTIKQSLDAQRLLAALSHPPYSLIPEKYEVTKGKDGSDRIRAGDRNLNVSDFLTKELHLSWQDAAQILRATYEQQTANVEVRPSQTPRADLRRAYQGWNNDRSRGFTAQWTAQRESEKNRRIEVKDEFLKRRGELKANQRGGTAAQIRAQVSILRMERVGKEMALREQIAVERAALKAEKSKPYTDKYKDFLTELSQKGDELALAELRRMQRHQVRQGDGEAAVRPQNPQPPAEHDPFHDDAALSYSVHPNGDVTYSRGAEKVIVDRGREVAMLKQDDRTLETVLRFATQKFGPKVEVVGTDDMKRRMAELAAEKQINVSFTDERLNQIMADRLASIGQERLKAWRERSATNTAKQPPKANAKATTTERNVDTTQTRNADVSQREQEARQSDQRDAKAERTEQLRKQSADTEQTQQQAVEKAAREKDSNAALEAVRRKRADLAARNQGTSPDPWQRANASQSPNATHQQRSAALADTRNKRGISDATLADAEKQGALEIDEQGLRTFKAGPKAGDGPAMLRGNDKDVHVVNGGVEALALRDIEMRAGREPPTTIIAGEGFKDKLENSPEASDLLKNADKVTVWKGHDQKQTTEAGHDTELAKDIVAARGKTDGVNQAQPPKDVRNLEDWNVKQHEQEQQLEQQRQQQEEQKRSAPRR